MARFVMAGGGTGGHVLPLIAVARELRSRGHEVTFVGTQAGYEARLVPEAGFPIEWIQSVSLAGAGVSGMLRALTVLPRSVVRCWRMLGRIRPHAVFSLGGFAAGPVAAAAILRRIPLVVMEPNAYPGAANRWCARWVRRALLGWPEAARYFPAGRAEVTGVPVREEFFALPAAGGPLTVLITGGSQGSRTLNNAFRESWPLFRESGLDIRFVHQCGQAMESGLAAGFAASGLDGQVSAFIGDMPAAFAEASVIVARAGAGSVAEIAAAGRPSILVPYPHAADDHQTRNAEVLARAGAARIVPDGEMNGPRLLAEVRALADPQVRARMAWAAKSLARPGAAARAAGILEQIAQKGG
ncbi:MAG: undecaprenyldiphospho-muramoylpentapeptide beta-N-acetylglucosaminyltransferase [Acidobacteria bacterium]|nr:undecaprenyldiphospho-muramoylpentapeptide beta-N-acetylglucosaminyltransferase [Acidobacteriota bacterium]